MDESDNIICSPDETMERLSFCKECKNLEFKDTITHCKELGCPINRVITFKFKLCPLENWK